MTGEIWISFLLDLHLVSPIKRDELDQLFVSKLHFLTLMSITVTPKMKGFQVLMFISNEFSFKDL